MAAGADACGPGRSASAVAQPFHWTAHSFDTILAEAEAALLPAATLSEAA